MSKFTSGPWSHDAKFPNSVWANGVWLASTNVETVPSLDTRTANARLIAAAPEMYAALRLLLETHCCDTGEADYKSEWDGDHTVCADCKPAYAALAKADGKEKK